MCFCYAGGVLQKDGHASALSQKEVYLDAHHDFLEEYKT